MEIYPKDGHKRAKAMLKKPILPIIISIFCVTSYLFAGENEKEVFQTRMIHESTTFSQGPNTYITVGIGGMSGDTTYQIGGRCVTPSGSGIYHFSISELTFPLDIWMISVEESKEFVKKNLKVSVGVKKTYTRDAGKMEDSDWLTSTNPSQLDVYSQSDAYLDALILGINISHRFFERPHWSFIAGVGYIYQNFDYECKLNRQWSPSGLSGYDYTGTGSVDLTYELTYSIPYIEIGTQYIFTNKWSLVTSLGYSPIVHAEDLDVHVLRAKVSEGDCDGDAILFSLKGRCNVSRSWFFALQLDYTYIKTDGRQKQYTDGAWSATIDQEITSEQLFGALSAGYAF
ncbi:MAG TPA: omptin family outer membrane protease [Desulfobacteraceae bacterium]|nr:omptin family outer membrane protease [Desulfobacteraceae bacterium]